MTDLEIDTESQLLRTSKMTLIVLSVARGIALFFAGFTLLNLSGEFFHDGFNASVWWIDVRGIPKWLSNTLILCLSLLLLDFARKPEVSRAVTSLRSLAILGAVSITVRDTMSFFTLLNRDMISSQFPLPFSLVVTVLLLLVMGSMLLKVPARQTSLLSVGLIATSPLFCLVTFPLLQIHCFGWTDYRRPADAAVVFGCKVYANGNLSTALSDRVRSASTLYHQGLVSHLIMSGGPGLGSVHETEAMRDFAITLGVPARCILTDRMGLSTDETVANTVPLLKERGLHRVLAVSHFFHLPRIKLTYQRAGIDVFTVPARQNNRLRNEMFLLVREVAALWTYYARPLTGV